MIILSKIKQKGFCNFLPIITLLFSLCYSPFVRGESYTLSVGQKVTISQSPYNGGYIDNVGLADYLDPHLGFSKNYDGSATITVNSYFNYTATVKLVFIERYQAYYSGRNHTRAATYYQDVSIKCNYVAPQPNVKPTKVLLPERVRVPLNKRVDIYPSYEPYGAKGTTFSWYQSQGTAAFAYKQYSDGGYYVTGRSPGIGSLSVKVDNDDNLYASTIIEVVDPDHLPPNNVILPSSIEISVGGHATLEPILVPEGTSTSYTWTSEDTSVASVSYGKVTGKKVGTTTITVKTSNNLKSTCKVTVVSQNGKDDEEDSDDNSTTGTIDGHDYIDLGLSVKWATTNVGANNPEEYGNYYAWGETTTKSSYSWSNYKYGSSVTSCTYIGSDISGTKYDAAYVNWGSSWRMPTKTEIGELISKCKFESHTQNGVKGYKITGPNGNNIFLPIAGVMRTSVSSECRYWASNVDDYQGEALLVTTKSNTIYPTMMKQMRFIGIPIRAVTESTSSTSPKLTLTASPSSGNVEKGTKVTLSAKANGSTVTADIYYTLNGTTPSKSSTKYTSSGITINEAYTLKAIAYKDGYETSDVLTQSYTIKTNSENILINATNFPDASFRNYLLSQSYGADGKLTENEISQIKKLDVSNYYKRSEDITSLKGIEFFTALTTLYCDNNQLTSLDVSKNTALTSLSCFSNQLTSLDVTKNTALTSLSCYNNKLTSLDVTKNTALTSLSCFSNQLTSLDVTKNTALAYLYCYNNKLTSLDVSKNTALIYLHCSSNKLTSLDVSKNTALAYLCCYNNQIKGSNMDAFIGSLPQVTSATLYIIDLSSDSEGNVCTTVQVNKAKEKGWTVLSSDEKDYEGSEVTTPDTDGFVSIGMGVLRDNYMFENETEVEILQNQEDKNIFKILNPYDGITNAYKGSNYEGSKEMEVAILGPGWKLHDISIKTNGIVYFSPVNTGYYYNKYEAYIEIYHPCAFSSMQAEDYWTHNKVLSYQSNGLPDKIQLAPYYYMEEIGGWDATQEDNAIIITFPQLTGIKGVTNNENKDTRIFDLWGRQLDKPQKGINIIGGKKVIVR